ncbi:fatty acid amide hydrolase-like [Bidens hawaiensis]|uniref:fatty acid amide hydrolase-like n=1 Tax=Bidens hawaiensis TaxID=980011 RepID=UPI00404A3ACA
MHGCEIVEITIPELQKMRIAHIVSYGSEALCSLMPRFLERNFQKLALDSRINLAVIQSFTGSNYVAAQRLRWRLMYYHMEIFKKVDIIVTPSTGMTAPKIHPSALACGESDLEVTASLMKYGLTANVLGFPAISVPVGYDKQGLPIGLQLIGRPWCEATILRLAAVIEQQWNEPKRKSVIYFDVTNTKGLEDFHVRAFSRHMAANLWNVNPLRVYQHDCGHSVILDGKICIRELLKTPDRPSYMLASTTPKFYEEIQRRYFVPIIAFNGNKVTVLPLTITQKKKARKLAKRAEEERIERDRKLQEELLELDEKSAADEYTSLELVCKKKRRTSNEKLK